MKGEMNTMETICSNPECRKFSKMETFKYIGEIRLSIAHCFEHAEWADLYLEEFIRKGEEETE